MSRNILLSCLRAGFDVNVVFTVCWGQSVEMSGHFSEYQADIWVTQHRAMSGPGDPTRGHVRDIVTLSTSRPGDQENTYANSVDKLQNLKIVRHMLTNSYCIVLIIRDVAQSLNFISKSYYIIHLLYVTALKLRVLRLIKVRFIF